MEWHVPSCPAHVWVCRWSTSKRQHPPCRLWRRRATPLCSRARSRVGIGCLPEASPYGRRKTSMFASCPSFLGLCPTYLTFESGANDAPRAHSTRHSTTGPPIRILGAGRPGGGPDTCKNTRTNSRVVKEMFSLPLLTGLMVGGPRSTALWSKESSQRTRPLLSCEV